MDRYMMKLLACVIAGLVCLSVILLALTIDFDGKDDESAKLKAGSPAEIVKLRS
ncbi:hypothetical protein [Rhizobium sp. OAE497]|uniref:hypothetical protein n=1 Tax=Rhizobium sp. OAE497 TaxID=2663796 RepID=UPI0018F48973